MAQSDFMRTLAAFANNVRLSMAIDRSFMVHVPCGLSVDLFGFMFTIWLV